VVFLAMIYPLEASSLK